MSRRPPYRLLAFLALAATVAAPLMGCGGGAAGTPADDDLIVTYFNMNGRTDVYRNQMLELHFSAPVNPDSLSDRTIRVLTGPDLKTPVPGALILDGNKVFFDPTRTQAQLDRDGPDSQSDNPFGYAALANHQVFVPGYPDLKTLTNLSGDPILGEYFASFTTSDLYIPELIQPRFVGVDGKGSLGFDPAPGPNSINDPRDGTTEVPYDAHIIFRFSEPIAPNTMDPGTSVIVLNLDEQEPITGGPLRVAGTLRASKDGRQYTFVPSFSYGPGPYRMQVELTQDIQDLAGNPLESPSVLYFRTESKPGEPLTRVITETFSNRIYEDMFNTDAEWGTTSPGRLEGGAITTTDVAIMYQADGVNSNRHGAGNNAFGPTDFPLVSEQGNQACPSWPNGCRMQSSYTLSDIGEAAAVTEVSWGPSSNALFAAVHPNIKIRLGHTKDTAGVLSPRFDENFLGGLPLPNYDGEYHIPQRADVDPQNAQRGFWPFPSLATPFEYNGEKGLLIDFQVEPANDCQLLRFWYHGTGAGFGNYPGIRNLVANTPDADRDTLTGAGQPLVHDMKFVKRRRTTYAQSKFYNTNELLPDYGAPILSPSGQPGGAELTLEWQGATDPTDDQTYTPWGSSIDIADNNRYIRFRATLISNLNSETVARLEEMRIPFLSR